MEQTRKSGFQKSTLESAIAEDSFTSMIAEAIAKTRKTSLETFFEITYTVPAKEVIFSETLLGTKNRSDPSELRHGLDMKYGRLSHHPIIFAHTHPPSESHSKREYPASMLDMEAAKIDMARYYEIKGRLPTPPVQAVIQLNAENSRAPSARIMFYQYTGLPGPSYAFEKWHSRDPMNDEEHDTCINLLVFRSLLKAKVIAHPDEWSQKTLISLARSME